MRGLETLGLGMEISALFLNISLGENPLSHCPQKDYDMFHLIKWQPVLIISIITQMLNNIESDVFSFILNSCCLLVPYILCQ